MCVWGESEGGGRREGFKKFGLNFFGSQFRTRRAMGGSVTFKAALTARLGLIRPSYEQVQKLISEHPPQLTPGIR